MLERASTCARTLVSERERAFQRVPQLAPLCLRLRARLVLLGYATPSLAHDTYIHLKSVCISLVKTFHVKALVLTSKDERRDTYIH